MTRHIRAAQRLRLRVCRVPLLKPLVKRGSDSPDKPVKAVSNEQ